MNRTCVELWAGGAVIVLLAMPAYGPALRGDWVWDDEIAVVANPLVSAEDGLKRLWFTTESWDYWPITYSTFWLERRLWGLWTPPYHVLNVLLHGVGAVLLWRVLRRLAVPGAWAASLLFALHPVNVEAVAWIVQRKTVLSGVFYFGSLLCFVRAEQERRRAWYAASLALFVLSLLSKTSGIMMPFVLLGIAWWLRGRITWADVRRGVPFFAVSAVLGVVNVWFQQNRAISTDVVRADSLAARLAGAGCAVWYYVYKAVWPLDLMAIYPRWQIDARSLMAWLPLVALVVVAVALWLGRGGWGRGPLAGGAYFVLLLAPVLGFVDIYFMRFSLVADHWQYHALPGVLAVVVGAVAALLGRLRASSGQTPVALTAAVACGLFALSWRQAGTFADEVSFWRDAAEKNPAALIVHGNLGRALYLRGRYEEALATFREAALRFPDDAGVKRQIGMVLIETGDLGGAETALREAIRLDPALTLAYVDLGRARLRKGDAAGAMAPLRKAVELAPKRADAHHNLAMAMQGVREYAAAAAEYRAALSLAPDDAVLLNNAAWLLATCPDDAVQDSRDAVRMAERAVELTGGSDPRMLKTLAAAKEARAASPPSEPGAPATGGSARSFE